MNTDISHKNRHKNRKKHTDRDENNTALVDYQTINSYKGDEVIYPITLQIPNKELIRDKKENNNEEIPRSLASEIPRLLASPTENTNNPQPVNGWNQQNSDTIKSWRRSISRTSFIYQLVSDKYNTRLSRVLLVAFIINTIISMLSAIKVVFNVVEDDWVKDLRISFDVITLILAASVTLLNGVAKMFDWQTFVTECSKYIERLESLYATVAGTIGLPPELRSNAVNFITKTDRTYLDLMRQRPQMRPNDYTWASENYETFIKKQSDSFESTQKYVGTDIIIDLV